MSGEMQVSAFDVPSNEKPKCQTCYIFIINRVLRHYRQHSFTIRASMSDVVSSVSILFSGIAYRDTHGKIHLVLSGYRQLCDSSSFANSLRDKSNDIETRVTNKTVLPTESHPSDSEKNFMFSMFFMGD